MGYWVYGRDSETGRNEKFLSDAANQEDAIAQATAQGIIVERTTSDQSPFQAERRCEFRFALPVVAACICVIGALAYVLIGPSGVVLAGLFLFVFWLWVLLGDHRRNQSE